MRGATGRGLRAGALLLVLLLLAACTYEDREPGLFGRTAGPTPTETNGSEETPDATAAIPVLGDAVWTSVDPPAVPVRIAVHSLRRVPNGTILDWSVTPLGGAGSVPGQPVPGGVRFRLDEQTDLALVDVTGGRIYRPLGIQGAEDRCLCSPAFQAEQDLALGVPRLLQVAFPALPATVRAIDVSVRPVPVFARVPVSPEGEVAAAIAETDLAAPVPPPPALGRTAEFTLPSGQRFAAEVNAVLASGTLTSVVWTLEVLSRGPGPGSGLRPELTRNDVWRVGPLRVGGSGGRDPSCLCLDPSVWQDHLEEPGRRITVVTNLGEIPRGTTTVDVLFPRVPPLRRLPVTTASDGAYRSAGSVRAPRRTWAYRPNRPQPPWPLFAWPTPAPQIEAGQFAVVVEPIRR